MDEQTTSVITSIQTSKSSILERISFVILLMVVFLTPFFFVPSSFVSVQFGTSLLFSFGVILSLLLFIISRLKNGYFELPRPFLFLFGSFIIPPIVYLLSSIVHGISRVQFLGYTFDVSTVGFIILSFVFTFLVSILFREKNRVFYSYMFIVLSSIVVSLLLVLRLIFGTGFLSFGIFTSLTSTVIGSWNNVGIFFGIGVILSLLTVEMLSLHKFMKLLISIALVLALFFLALVNFSTIWVIVAITSLLFSIYKIFSYPGSFWNDFSIKDKLIKGPTYSIIVFVISVIFIFWGSNIGNSLADKLKVTNIDVRPTLSITYDIMKKTLSTEPLFGSGPNTFALQWLSYKPADISTTVFWNTDFAYGVGLIPTFAVTTGLVGILSWLLFFVIFLYFGFRSLFIRVDDTFTKYLLTSSFFIAFYLWLMTFIYIPSVVVSILTFFFTGIFFAVLSNVGLVSVKKVSLSSNPKIGFVSSLVMVAFLAGGLALGYELYKNSMSLWYFQKASYAINVSGDVADAEKLIVQAISIVPQDVYYRAQTDLSVAKINTLFTQDLSQLNKNDVQTFFSNELGKAINSGLNARKIDPTNYLNWVSLGQAYTLAVPPQTGVAGAYESAKSAYEEALKINPQNPAINLLLARLEVAKGDIKKAKEYTFSAIKQKQNYLDAYFLLSQLEVTDKNVKGAIDSVTVASVIDPSNPSIFFQLGLLQYNNSDYNGAIESLNKSIGLAPGFANAKYFLGLAYSVIGDKAKAIKEFEDLKVTNPDSVEVKLILTNLTEGRAPFVNAKPPIDSKPEKRPTLPIKDSGNQ